MANSKAAKQTLTGGTGEPDMFQAMAAAHRKECERCGQDWSARTVSVEIAPSHTVQLCLCKWCAKLPSNQHVLELGYANV